MVFFFLTLFLFILWKILCMYLMYLLRYLFLLFLFMFMYVSVWVNGCSRRPKEDFQYLVAGVTSSCEPPSVGVGNWIWVLCNSSKRYQLQVILQFLQRILSITTPPFLVKLYPCQVTRIINPSPHTYWCRTVFNTFQNEHISVKVLSEWITETLVGLGSCSSHNHGSAPPLAGASSFSA